MISIALFLIISTLILIYYFIWNIFIEKAIEGTQYLYGIARDFKEEIGVKDQMISTLTSAHNYNTFNNSNLG
jgi:hypothetical protein